MVPGTTVTTQPVVLPVPVNSPTTRSLVSDDAEIGGLVTMPLMNLEDQTKARSRKSPAQTKLSEVDIIETCFGVSAKNYTKKKRKNKFIENVVSVFVLFLCYVSNFV